MSEKPAAPGREPPKVGIDTNLFIRALLNSPGARKLLDAYLTGRCRLITSDALLEELAEVLARPKFRRVFSAGEARQMFELIVRRSEVVKPISDPPECRDPDDRILLATALAGGAAVIVTADADLRADDELRTQMLERGVEIVGVEGFLAYLDAAAARAEHTEA